MYQQTQRYLHQIESLLKRHQMWQSEPLPMAAFESSVPFCHDTMKFEQWLQFVFLQKMQNIINTKQPLPTNLSIAPMAELMFDKKEGGSEITALLLQLDNFLGSIND